MGESDPADQLQLIDGPVEHQGLHDPAALRLLVTTGQVPIEARALNPTTMRTGSVGDLLGIAPEEVTGSATGSAAAGAPEKLGGGTIALGERQGGDTALERFAATFEGAAVTAVKANPEAPGPALQAYERAQTALIGAKQANLVTVHAVERQSGAVVVAHQPMDGRAFSELMIGAPPGMELVVEWAGGIAAGLWAAAKLGVHHLALSPDMIRIGRDNVARVWGFGAAGVVQAKAPPAWAKALSCRAPELLRGEPGDHRSDVFALAAIVYQLLGARAPYPGADATSIQQAMAAGQPESLSERDSRIPTGFDQALRQALSPEPQHRQASTSALARELRDAAAAGPAVGGSQRRSSQSTSQASGPAPVGPSRSPASSTTLPTPPNSTGGGRLILAVLVLAILGGGGWFGWRFVQDQATNEVDERPVATTEPAPLDPSKDQDDHDDAGDGDDSEVATAAAKRDPVRGSEIELLAAWQQAEDDDEWQEAHRLAQAFALRFPRRVAAVRLHMPLVIEPDPAEAVIVVDGVEAGSGRMAHRYPPGTDALVVVQAPGRRPAVRPLRELHGEWRWAPKLPPLPALRWLSVLPGEPLSGPAGFDDAGRAIVHLAAGASVIAAADGGLLQIVTDDNGAVSLGPPLRYRGATVLQGSQRMVGLDNRRIMQRWSAPIITEEQDDVPEFTTGGTIGAHELIPDQGKLWIPGAGKILRCFALQASRASELAPTTLPAPASAPPAVVQVSSATSAVAVPCGRRLAVFDGSVASPGSGARLDFVQDIGASLTTPPLALRYNDRPWLLIADDQQRLLAIDPLPGKELRLAAEWYLPAPPATAPVRLGDGRCAIGLDGGQVVAIDLDRSGLILWTAITGSDLTGALAVAGDRILSCHEDGHLRIIDAGDGKLRAAHDLGIAPIGGPVVCGDTAVVVSRSGVALGIALD